MAPYQYRGLYRTTPIPTCVVSLSDLQRLHSDLEAKTREALERYLADTSKPPDWADERFEQLKREAREVGKLTITVHGADGEQIVSSSDEGLTPARLPERIDWISFDSAAALKLYNVTPLNRFILRLDFTEPPGFFSYNPWDQPTPNTSQLEVIGSDQTWVTAVYESTLAFFRKRRRRRGWLHTQTAFNLLNWVIGFPGALWIVYRLHSSTETFVTIHPVLQGGVYLYVFLLALLVFRGVIWGFRWIFPVIEIEGARSNKARAAIGALLGSPIVTLGVDVLRAIFW